MVFNLLFAFVSGVVFASFLTWRLLAGTIRVDWTDPEKDIYRIELDNLGLLEKRRWILLKVDRHADLSQK